MADSSLGKKERRKSLSVFSPSTTSSLSGLGTHDRSPSDDVQVVKKKRRNSGFFGGRNPSPPGPSHGLRRSGTADTNATAYAAAMPNGAFEASRPRRKSIQKKRASVFGSLRSFHSFEDDDRSLGRSKTSPSMDDDEASDSRQGIGSIILHHGEIQTTGGMWRKKSQYLVLTDTHLVRLKSQTKAADMFPSIPPSYARSGPSNRQSITSISSLGDPQLSTTSDSAAGIPLNSIIAVYMLDDGKPSSTVEVAYLDERAHKAAFIQMQTPDLQELNLWMVGIRSAAELIRQGNPLPFDQRSIEYVVRMLEYERDYDPETFRIFRVIQMACSKSQARTSSEDLTKLSPTGCYLALGSHKLHLIPLQKVSNRGSAVSLSDLDNATSFGLMNLTCLSMEYGDDSLHLTFRIPLCKPFSVFLASVHSLEVAFWIRQQTEFLRPLWVRQPYDFIVPRDLGNESNFPPVDLNEDYGCFDRTLVAYSASYDIDTSNIRYTIDVQCDDAPCFKLLPPASPSRRKYTALELVAVLRALRYNESFRSISFSGVSLDALQGLRDYHGLDKDMLLSRAGAPIHITGQESLSVLSQEIRALTLKSNWLRRLDFSNTLSRTPKSDNESHDPGCGIPEAIFPICRRELTSVDWVVLNGIKLGDSDLDYLVDAASQGASQMRALEVGNCGLSVHDLDLLLSTTVAQAHTLEAINISGVQGRLSPDILQQYLGYFKRVKKLDLSRISRTSGSDPLITAETLINWHLEELSLSRTKVNRETVDAIATYLASDRSRGLRVLRLDQCGLTGQDVAILLHSSVASDCSRDLHLHVNENRLDLGCSFLFDALAKSKSPPHLSMRMIDFKKEEQFRDLVEALRKNRSLKYLDISKASLPYDAGPETCRALQLMFEENETLEDLDISGESAHLDVARFGIGLNLALTGLKKNRSLKVLRIEHQKLGLQGANTLASVLEENDCLREVYCENNDINLQSFTVLVNGLQRNKSLLSLSYMDRDRIHSLDKVRREVESVKRDMGVAQSSTTSTIRRSLNAAKHATVGHKSSKHSHASGHLRSGVSISNNLAAAETSPFLHHDIEVILQSLNLKWDAEVSRLRRYLFRNFNVANGIEVETAALDGDDAASDGRPNTAASLATMLDNLKFDVTVSEQEIQPRPQTNTQPSPKASQPNEASHLDIFRSLDTETNIQIEPRMRPQTAPFSVEYAPQILPSDYASSSGPSSRLAVPVPSMPSVISKSSSVRSARSSSTVSTSAGTAASARSSYGTTSSTLRGILSGGASRERRRTEKMRPGAVCVSRDRPPTLQWSPPKLDLGDFR
ncbi:leucine rich repeat protein [Aspergillus nomiae NRRL 13137]|uniref:Leucine rich repeat protein n=1 Tax=Aspergillus nomiae NRRL (strain ATCC 15546 / NRRL 13137 / CBS 260.88 / M93) TaxID=1509407 RepID=A0A0L1ILL3_ASPN3|nr:leucine rich repeat protein [Aspergillus nomiae NRRL 13137]KNG80160.1 leucine rich repeat protein [Aspergillus nomiae NRRL 13137]